MGKKISRREFVGEASRAAVGAGVLLGAGTALGKAAPAKSKVVQVSHAKVVSKDRKVDPAAVKAMLRRGMKALTGSDQPFKQLFRPTDRVGLKINCLGRRRIHTHKELISALADELQAVGIPAKNIVVWDRFEQHMKKCGYELNDSGKGPRVIATEKRGEEGGRHDKEQRYVSERDSAEGRRGGTASRLSEIFTSDCDKVINVAILKDHGLAGVTLSLKNIAFGICDNNRRFHAREHIGPFIADFCAREDVRKKFVLHIVDGLEGCFDGGPAPASEDQLFQPQTLWLGMDPVALDSLGAEHIEARRKQAGLPSLQADGRAPNHIRLAAEKGLGTDDRKRIDLEKIALG